MATKAQLSENSHPGFEGIKSALCLAEIDANSNTALGMQPCLRQNGTGSRCSGKERDAESGLDYFLARYYSGAQGRFTSPDPGPAKPSDPQVWNRYSYTRNNPLKYVDPTGEVLEIAGDEKERKRALEAMRAGLRKEDRLALRIIEGTGKNGLEKGKYYVDAAALNGVRSKDENYNALRQIANSPGYAILEIAGQNDQISYHSSVSRSIQAFTFGQINTGVTQAQLDAGQGIGGITLSTAASISFADIGSPTSPLPGRSLIYLNGQIQSAETLAITTAHELYGHLHPAFLGGGRQTSHKQVGDAFDQIIANIEDRTRRNYKQR